jgi:hypothetical protein
MMLAIAIVAWVLAATPPNEIVIDCSTWPGKVQTAFEVQFETRDGKAIKEVFIVAADTDPGAVRVCLWVILRHYEWKFAYRDNHCVIVWGSATSPVKSVSFKSTTTWTPVHFTRPGPPWLPLAPAPREKKE